MRTTLPRACRGRLVALASSLALSLGGCRFLDTSCGQDIERPGIVVAIGYALTGQPPNVPMTVTFVEGTYVERLPLTPGSYPTPLTIGGAGERPGTYTVTIDATGYRTWMRSNVRVRDGTCHVETTRLDAALERQ